jgi:hypothetical protein
MQTRKTINIRINRLSSTVVLHQSVGCGVVVVVVVVVSLVFAFIGQQLWMLMLLTRIVENA